MTSVGGGGQTTNLFKVLTVLQKALLAHKTCLYIVGCAVYIFTKGEGVDASQANRLRRFKALDFYICVISKYAMPVMITEYRKLLWLNCYTHQYKRYKQEFEFKKIRKKLNLENVYMCGSRQFVCYEQNGCA